MLEIAREKRRRYIEKFLRRQIDGVVEKKTRGWYHVTTGNYLKLIVTDKYKLHCGGVYQFLLKKMYPDFKIEAIPSH